MFSTIQTGSHALAQGTYVRSYLDGRIEIDTGGRSVTGMPLPEAARSEPDQFVAAFPFSFWRGGLISALTT